MYVVCQNVTVACLLQEVSIIITTTAANLVLDTVI